MRGRSRRGGSTHISVALRRPRNQHSAGAMFEEQPRGEGEVATTAVLMVNAAPGAHNIICYCVHHADRLEVSVHLRQRPRS
jgi:hypothetical protein